MNSATLLIVILLAIWVIAAGIYVYKNKRNGGCAGCASSGSCGSHCGRDDCTQKRKK